MKGRSMYRSNERSFKQQIIQLLGMATAVLALALPVGAEGFPSLANHSLELTLTSEPGENTRLVVTSQDSAGILAGYLRRSDGDTPVSGTLMAATGGTANYVVVSSSSGPNGNASAVVVANLSPIAVSGGYTISFRERVSPTSERRYEGAIRQTSTRTFITGVWYTVTTHSEQLLWIPYTYVTLEGPFPFAATDHTPG
jgi:hypothetical protein